MPKLARTAYTSERLFIGRWSGQIDMQDPPGKAVINRRRPYSDSKAATLFSPLRTVAVGETATKGGQRLMAIDISPIDLDGLRLVAGGRNGLLAGLISRRQQVRPLLPQQGHDGHKIHQDRIDQYCGG